MKAFWTREARADRNAIYAYIEADDINAATALDSVFSKAAIRLTQHPMSGRRGASLERANWWRIATTSLFMTSVATAFGSCVFFIQHRNGRRQQAPEIR